MPLDISFQEDNMKKSARMLLPFLALLFVVMGCSEESRRQSRERAEVAARESKLEKDREAYAAALSKKFDIYPDCLFRFRAGGSQSKTFYAKNCNPKRGVTKPQEFLEPDDIDKLKSLGFEQVEIDSWESAWKAYTTLYKFGQNSTLEFVGYK